MKEKILESAKHNSLPDSPVIEGKTDHLGQMWVKLDSISDLDNINDLLSPEFQKLLKLKGKRKEYEQVIKAGVTFGFFYNSDKQLEFNK